MLRNLVDIAKECRLIIEAAHRQLGEKLPYSYTDLCADQITDVALADIKSAIVVAGFDYKQTDCSHRKQSTGRSNRGTITYCMDCGKVLDRKSAIT